MPKNRTSACGRMLEHVLPPNVPADTMQGIIVGSLAIGALTAAIDFTVHYAATYRGMFYWDGRLMDTALMGPFSAYVEPVVIVFGVVVLLALLSAVMLYSSYYLGGRSIYQMRRLPDGRQTLRRQVWTAPLVWAVCAVAAAAVLTGRCPRGAPILVQLPGGTLEVCVQRDDTVLLTGDAAATFSGTVLIQPCKAPRGVV
mgnify:CR=1 FL=1